MKLLKSLYSLIRRCCSSAPAWLSTAVGTSKGPIWMPPYFFFFFKTKEVRFQTPFFIITINVKYQVYTWFWVKLGEQDEMDKSFMMGGIYDPIFSSAWSWTEPESAQSWEPDVVKHLHSCGIHFRVFLFQAAPVRIESHLWRFRTTTGCTVYTESFCYNPFFVSLKLLFVSSFLTLVIYDALWTRNCHPVNEDV